MSNVADAEALRALVSRLVWVDVGFGGVNFVQVCRCCGKWRDEGHVDGCSAEGVN